MIMRVAAAISVLLIVVLALAYTGPAFAQDEDEAPLPEEPSPPAAGPGTITGMVTSLGSHAVPEATVTLYDMDGNLADVPENPQLTSTGVGTNAGVYTFYDVPPGIYNVTAEKGGSQFFAIANLTWGTATANVVLPEHVETAPAYSEPTPSPPPPRPFYTFLPIRVKQQPAQQTPPGNVMPWAATAGAAGALLILAWRKRV